MKKQVRKHFSYTQCDDFAAYLQEMSRKGFHFTEWKGGLIFEKGEPEDVTYQVEVFADGEETDQRPSRDTEEYREYCEAAGWKFLDGKAKFCIFRKEEEDAPDILAPAERIPQYLQCGKKAGNASDPFSFRCFCFWKFSGMEELFRLFFPMPLCFWQPDLPFRS